MLGDHGRSRGLRRRAAVAAAALAALTMLGPVGPGAVPAGADDPRPSNGAWVTSVYRDQLDRRPTPGQHQHWRGRLDAGTSRRTVADTLAASREKALLMAQILLTDVLGRPSDPTSESYWTDRLTTGTKDSTFASFVYGSPEVYARLGSTPEAYVAFLYRDILGREPDAAGAAYWSARVAAGENRTGLARSWYLSAEATGLRAGLLFLSMLDRPPTATERADWAGRLRTIDVRQAEATLAASTEYDRLVTTPQRSTRLTAGNGPSTDPSVSADGRVIAFVSTASDLTPGGSPPGADVFVLDRRTGRLRAITAGDGASLLPDVSADGSTVVFQSAATNLVAGDDNGHVDVFRASTAGGPIERLTDGDDDSHSARTSGDGSVVVFSSKASDLVEDDPNEGVEDVFVHTDGSPSTLERIGGEGSTVVPDVSSDGGTLVFQAAGYDAEVGAETPAQVYAVRLPLGADPEPLGLSEGFLATVPRVSADGSRVVYIEMEPVGGSYQSTPWVVTLTEGEVVARTASAVTYKPNRIVVSDDGRVGLQDGWVDGQGVVGRQEAIEGQTPITRPLPVRSDLTADGRIVVGSAGGQLRLYQP
jgi:hypothetical protein